MTPRPFIQRKHKSKSDKRFATCILHIGTEKTGTKAIQEYLRENRKALLKQGILYPIRATSEHASQWEFVAAVHDKPWTQDVGRNLGITDATDQEKFRATFSEKLEKDFAQATTADTLLISCEHFQSRLSSLASVKRLREFLEPWVQEFVIVVYFRRQDRLALSFLSTRLKSAVRVKQISLANAQKAAPTYYDYWQLYQNWSAVFGENTVRARLYDSSTWPDKSLLSDFCHTCGFERIGASEPVLNQSLNRRGFQFLRVLNNRIPVTPGDHSDKRRRNLVEAVSRTHAGKYYPVGRREAEDFFEAHKANNEKLRRAAFPYRPAPLFDEDFSDYPDEAEDDRPKYFEAVEVAMTAWSTQEVAPPRNDRLGSRLLDFLLPLRSRK